MADGVSALEKAGGRTLAALGHGFDTVEALVGGGFDEDAMVAGKEKVVFAVEDAFLAIFLIGIALLLWQGPKLGLFSLAGLRSLCNP